MLIKPYPELRHSEMRRIVKFKLKTEIDDAIGCVMCVVSPATWVSVRSLGQRLFQFREHRLCNPSGA